MSDPINPDHYRFAGSRYEFTRVMEAWGLIGDHFICQIMKYCLRSTRKPEQAVVDLKKARWYLDRKIKRLEGKRVR
tara:strand:+ start:2781 stop:3008 length:228 start_codon:yes stop_codon:yes gene_type:complete